MALRKIQVGDEEFEIECSFCDQIELKRERSIKTGSPALIAKGQLIGFMKQFISKRDHEAQIQKLSTKNQWDNFITLLKTIAPSDTILGFEEQYKKIFIEAQHLEDFKHLKNYSEIIK